ncbi:MAG: hypothetical protein MJ207_01530 [Bacilli bacterium]|nr:hypothetical protein [Bacilli bacterium]
MKFNRLFILGAISLPFLASCGCSSSNDQEILDEINAVLDEERDEIDTCYDAVKIIEQHNIDMNDHKFSNKKDEFVYDAKAKQYVIMNGDDIVKKSNGYQASENTLDYFKSVFTYNPNSKYSQYLDKRAEVPEQLLITTGFDIGAHIDIPNIAYTNLSGEAHDVIIRTYSDYVSFLAPLDTVHHYEIATNVIVTDIATLDNHADTAYIKAIKGHINFGGRSNTMFFEVEEGSEKDVSISVETGVIVSATINIDNPGEGGAKLTPASVSTKDDLKNALSTANFIRLTDDIEYTDEAIKLFRSVCIDLSGYKITFNGDTTTKQAICVTGNYSLYLLDSQGILDDNSGIVLKDSYIYVNEAILMINGGKITQEDTQGEPSAAVVAGKNSTFTMYGGKIETKSTKRVPNNVCVTTYDTGATVNIAYGTLISETSCVALNASTNEVASNDGNATLNINGGFFTSGTKTPAACIDYNIPIDLTIKGGTFTGPTCLSVTSGNININGGVFNATGQYRDQYFGADGSVIDIYKGAASKDDLKLDITDTNMYTNFAYILSAQKGAKANVGFHEGAYSSYLGATNILDGADIVVTIDNPDDFIRHGL